MAATPRDVVKEEHGYDDWPGADAAPLASFLPDLDRIPGYSHESRSALPGLRGAFIDHFTEDGGTGRISVRVIHYESARDAHEGVVDVLEDSMAPRLPRCEERGLDLDDPCFCGYGEPLDFVVFARANVLVRVESIGQEPVAVAAVAAELDRQLAEAT